MLTRKDASLEFYLKALCILIPGVTCCFRCTRRLQRLPPSSLAAPRRSKSAGPADKRVAQKVQKSSSLKVSRLEVVFIEKDVR
jgi:hypothetical protein